MTLKKILLSSEEVKEGGQALLLGSGTWTVPSGVFSISVVLIEGGATGGRGGDFVIGTGGAGGVGGLGGRRRYINNVPVTPGQQISYTNGALSANFGSILTGTTGGVDAGRAGQGGTGGGATQYQTTAPTTGGCGGPPASYLDLETDYSFLLNQGIGSGEVGRFPGGGGGGGRSGYNLQGSTSGLAGAVGGAGCIYVLWPGDSRQFPRDRVTTEEYDAPVFDSRDRKSVV